MRKTFLILILLLFGKISSQSIQNLDNKNGFKEYKLGTNKEVFVKKGIVLLRPDYLLEKENTYQVIDDNMNIFDYPIDVLWFEFDDKNNLGGIFISVDVGNYIDDFTTKLRSSFGKEQYGQPVNDDVFKFIWKGKKVQLEMTLNAYLDNKNKYQAILIINSLAHLSKKINSGF